MNSVLLQCTRKRYQGSQPQRSQKPPFFDVSGTWDWFQSLLQALASNFPSKMPDLGAYVSSYVTFRRFCWVWKVANPFLMIWGSFSLLLSSGRGSLLALKGVLCLGFVICVIWIWIGKVSFVEKLDFQGVIKSAASAASPKTKIQESRGASGRRLGRRAKETARLPWIPGFWSSGSLR